VTGTIAITMAGAGSRFTKAGYTRPKYEIAVGGRPLFDWSMMALSAFVEAGWRTSFATRKEQEAGAFLANRCAALGMTMGERVELDGMTDGQATTALYLAELATADEPFLVFNIDTFVAPHAMRPDQIAAEASGWVPCFPGPGDGWSFARTDDTGGVVELREKQRISPHATVGLYWFRSAGLFMQAYRDYFSDGRGTEKGERYIAPMYNWLIERGDLVTIAEIAMGDVGMLGTPEQVAEFRTTPPPGAIPFIQAD
jgi:dTDP-glucose pyrophosphorylase